MKKVALFILVTMLALTVCAYAETAPVVAAPITIDLTPLFQAIIMVMAALVTGRLLPWIKARTSEAQRERMMACVRTLVYAAEQLYKNREIQDRLDYVQEGLLERGFEVDRDAIEAEVRALRLADGIFLPGDAIVKEVPDNG